jgi:hypothetical protein
MKKLTRISVLVIAMAIIVSQSTVKAQAFKNGDMVGNLGVGFGWYGYGYGTTSLPAFSLSLEKGIKDLTNIGPLSIGGIIGFKHAKYAYTSSYDWSWNDIIVAARGAIHYDLFKVSKLDTYGGVALGVRIESETYYNWVAPYGANDYKKFTTSFTHGLFALYVGGRYYFSDKLAGFGELGYGLGYLTLGLSYKFN